MDSARKSCSTPQPDVSKSKVKVVGSTWAAADNAVDNWLPDSRYGSTESIEYSQDHFLQAGQII